MYNKNLTIMKVGIPKEIKNNENRVGMTPAGVENWHVEAMR
jgi:alanine dehydrogenase